ncbi:MAG TPA: immunoglobulin domain-containing protein [Verrucomicrobiota bacterium]|nr:immunoglobulin domain-containing protein [Verrucomicrobiota bacterium]
MRALLFFRWIPRPSLSSVLLVIAATGFRVVSQNILPPNGPGYALQLDGVDDYAIVRDSPALRLSNQFTIEFWFKPATFAKGTNYLLGRTSPDTSRQAAVIFGYTASNRVEFYGRGYSGADPRPNSALYLPDIGWHHIAYTYDGGNWSGYLDGAQVFSVARVFSLSTAPNDWLVGTAVTNVNRSNLAGAFDEIRLWNVGRTAAQIQEAMHRQLFGNETGLVGYWRLDEGGGTTASDATGHGATATLVNGPAWPLSTVVPFAPPVVTSAASGVLDTSVTLNGIVDGRTSVTPSEAYFQWGYSVSLGNELRPGFIVSPGAVPQNFSAPLSGLVRGTTYYFRAVAMNENGASYGATLTFTSAGLAAYPLAVLADAPIANYRFNDVPPIANNSGTLGPSADGTYSGGATSGWEAPRPPDFLGFEADNTALQLDGAGDFVRTVNGLLNGKPRFTLTGWIRRATDQTGRAGLFGQNDLVEFGYLDNNTLQAWTDDGLNVAPNPFPNGEWSHVALVSDSSPGSLTLYTNGLPAGSRSHRLGRGNNNPFNIGGGGVFDPVGNDFIGQIDEVAVFDKALSAEQIAIHYFSAVASPPIITRQPQSTNLFEGATLGLSVRAVGTPALLYKWYYFGGEIRDQTNASLVISNVMDNASGSYFVEVMNDYGAIASAFVEVNVMPTTPPSITHQPVSVTRYAGARATFSVAATGSSRFSYQWQKAGANLPGETNSSLVLSNVESPNAGNYRAIVADSAGFATSAVVTLTVLLPVPGSHEQWIVAAAPKAFWRFNEANGTTAFDYYGGHDAIYVGGAVPASVAPRPPQLPGFEPDNRAAQFNGSTAYINGPIGFLNSVSNFTMIGWIRRTADQADRAGLFGQNDFVEFG